MKDDFSRLYVDDVWNELKDKNLVQYKPGLKLDNRLSGFQK
jgi:hypothetical protein